MNAQHLKTAGISQVAANNAEWIEKVRRRAVRISKSFGKVTTDDLRNWTKEEPTHPNAWGAVFKDKRFKCIGRTASVRPSSHGREIKVWRAAA